MTQGATRRIALPARREQSLGFDIQDHGHQQVDEHRSDRRPGGARDPWLKEYSEQERSEEHTSELQSRLHLVCRLLLEKKKKELDTEVYLSTLDHNIIL